MSRRRKAQRAASEKERQLARTLESGDRYREAQASGSGWLAGLGKSVALVSGLLGIVVAARTLFPVDGPAQRMQALEEHADHLRTAMRETRDLTDLRALEIDYQETIAKIGDIREEMRLGGDPLGLEAPGSGAEPATSVTSARATPRADRKLPEPRTEPEPERAPEFAVPGLPPEKATPAQEPTLPTGAPSRPDEPSTAGRACPEQRAFFELGGGLRLELYTPPSPAACEAQRRRHAALAHELARYWPGP